MFVGEINLILASSLFGFASLSHWKVQLIITVIVLFFSLVSGSFSNAWRLINVDLLSISLNSPRLYIRLMKCPLFVLQDERFNDEVDTQTGYRTKALLCMPIKDAAGDVIGVAQVINKLGGDQCFTALDEKASPALVWNSFISHKLWQSSSTFTLHMNLRSDSRFSNVSLRFNKNRFHLSKVETSRNENLNRSEILPHEKLVPRIVFPSSLCHQLCPSIGTASCTVERTAACSNRMSNLGNEGFSAFMNHILRGAINTRPLLDRLAIICSKCRFYVYVKMGKVKKFISGNGKWVRNNNFAVKEIIGSFLSSCPWTFHRVYFRVTFKRF